MSVCKWFSNWRWNVAFIKATKEQSRLRMALVGSSGSGKTYTSLVFAKTIAGDKRFAVIDSERGSASKYADQFDFDVLNLTSFSPEEYVKAIKEAEAAGYAVIVVDSLSHAWNGKDGALEQVDKAVARNRNGGNSFAAWREVTPMHNALIDAILQSPAHIICTMRTKTEYVLEENERGKKVPRKIGTQPVQRDGMDYEFDIVGDMDQDHKLIVGKTRCKAIDRAVVQNPGEDFAKTILAWLTDGAPVTAPAPAPVTPTPAAPAAEPAKPATPKVEFANLVKAWTEIDSKSPDFKAACADILKRACGKAVAPNAATDDEFLTAVAWVRLHQGDNFATVLSANGEAVTA